MDCWFPHIYFWVVSFPVHFWSPFWRGKWPGKLSLLSTVSLNSQNREYKSDCRSVTWLQGQPSWEMALARPRIAVLSKVSCCLLAISVWQMNNTNEQHCHPFCEWWRPNGTAKVTLLWPPSFCVQLLRLLLTNGIYNCLQVLSIVQSDWGVQRLSALWSQKRLFEVESCIHVFVFMGWRGRFILEGLAVGKCDHRALRFVVSMVIYHCEVIHFILSGDSLPLTQS